MVRKNWPNLFGSAKLAVLISARWVPATPRQNVCVRAKFCWTVGKFPSARLRAAKDQKELPENGRRETRR